MVDGNTYLPVTKVFTTLVMVKVETGGTEGSATGAELETSEAEACGGTCEVNVSGDGCYKTRSLTASATGARAAMTATNKGAVLNNMSKACQLVECWM